MTEKHTIGTLLALPYSQKQPSWPSMVKEGAVAVGAHVYADRSPNSPQQLQYQYNHQYNRVVVFVHGFGSSPTCWNSLIELFNGDPSIVGKFRLERGFKYPTKWFNFSPLTRIPTLQECAAYLESHLRQPSFADYEITLIGHSLGGLVIQAYLAKAFRDGRGAELKNVRQVIFIATPHHGSNTFALSRNILSRIFPNPQERILRVLDPEIHEVVREFNQRIVNWPIAVRSFWGMQDGIVPEASGRGPHSEASPLPGDHFSILAPADQGDRRYSAIAEAIREPIGHNHIFEIDLFEVEVAVQPLSGDFKEQISFGRHKNSKLVTSDNKADVTHRVTFSRNNRCAQPFKMRYRTRNDGAILAHTSHPNLADAQELGVNDDYGYEHLFKFIPEAGSSYAVQWDVYRGFDAGHRDIHFHFNKPDTRSHYRKFVLRLDLTPYLKRGFALTVLPALYYHPQEPTTCEECRKLPLSQPVHPSFQHDAGIWEWELADIRHGVLTVRWDLVKWDENN